MASSHLDLTPLLRVYNHCIDSPNKKVLAKDIMTQKVISVSPDTSIFEVAKIISEHNFDGMPVVDGSTFIGRISKTTDRRSLVILLTDNDLNVPVISNRGTRGKVNGQLGKLVLLNQVLQRDPLFLDDIFFTSGEEGFPPKLLIGKVVHIDTDDVDVYKQAQIAPYAEIDLIKKVFVLEER